MKPRSPGGNPQRVSPQRNTHDRLIQINHLHLLKCVEVLSSPFFNKPQWAPVGATLA